MASNPPLTERALHSLRLDAICAARGYLTPYPLPVIAHNLY